MRLYSDFLGRRTLQLVGDVVAIIFVVVGIAAAFATRGAISALEVIGINLEASGVNLSKTMTDIGGDLARVPFIGESIKAPFNDASNAGTALAGAGGNWQVGVNQAADTAGWGIAAIVIVVVALAWVTPRLRGAARRREAADLAALPSSLDLLALRALSKRKPQDVVKIAPDVVASWRRGDPDVVRRLAALELRAAGVRLENVR